MKPNTDGRFQLYDLDEKETVAGTVVSHYQWGLFKTRQARLAEQLLNLKIDPLNPLNAVQQQSYLQGGIDTIQMILDESEEMTTRINTQAEIDKNS